jgi:hypothetical protein
MIQYYRGLWTRHSEILAPLTSLVRAGGHTKVTRSKKTKKRAWHWDEVHKIVFENIKATIARDVVVAYPDYSQEFQIYTDASSTQLGAVVTQGSKPVAFFSRKLTDTQQCYSVTEIEVAVLVEKQNEFKDMLWG